MVPVASVDPWSAVNQSFGESKDGWMLTYIDVLTLLLTLLVLLLAYQKIEHEEMMSSSFPINKEYKVAEKKRGKGLAEQQVVSSDSEQAENREKPFVLVGGPAVTAAAERVASTFDDIFDTKLKDLIIDTLDDKVEDGKNSKSLADADVPKTPVENIAMAEFNDKARWKDQKQNSGSDPINKDYKVAERRSGHDLAEQQVVSSDSKQAEHSKKPFVLVESTPVIAAAEGVASVFDGIFDTKLKDLITDTLDDKVEAAKYSKSTVAADIEEIPVENIAMAELNDKTRPKDDKPNSGSGDKNVSSNGEPNADTVPRVSPIEDQQLFRGTSEILKANVLITDLANSDNDRVEIVQDGHSIRIEVNEDVLFSSGKADLKAAGSALLGSWIDLLKQQQGTIFVEGHTDNRPIATVRFPSNWELSSARAGSVTRQFIAQGIDPKRLRAVGYADTRPRGDNNTPEGQKRNRRVSIVIQP